MLLVHEETVEHNTTEYQSSTELQEGRMEEVVELSSNSVVGLSNPKTMKVKGKIAQSEVATLIDCGATHNFISNRLVQKLGLSWKTTPGYCVLLGSGQAIKGEDICKGVILTLQNIEIVEDFLPLDLGSADVILGMKWLELLGGMQVNWKLLTMRFKVGEVPMIQQGDPSLSASLISLKAMWKNLREQGEKVLVELGHIGMVDHTCDFNVLDAL